MNYFEVTFVFIPFARISYSLLRNIPYSLTEVVLTLKPNFLWKEQWQ